MRIHKSRKLAIVDYTVTAGLVAGFIWWHRHGPQE